MVCSGINNVTKASSLFMYSTIFSSQHDVRIARRFQSLLKFDFPHSLSHCSSTLVVDGIELKRSMPETLARGTPGVDFAKGVPVLHGTTLDDGVGFMGV